MSGVWRVPFVLRGELIEAGADSIEHQARRGVSIRSPDARRHLAQLCLASPGGMADLYELGFEDIVAYLARLGSRLHVASNSALREALELGARTCGLPRSVLQAQYETLPALFRPEFVRDMAERSVGIRHLEGWAVFAGGGSGRAIRVRAYGARCAHVIAGTRGQPRPRRGARGRAGEYRRA